MTTIAYKDGVMVGDRRVTNGSLIEPDVTKIFKRESDGALIGVAGNLGMATRFAKWFLDGEIGEGPCLFDKDKDGEAEALIVRPDGKVENYYKSGIIFLESGFYAIGSGACAALTALDLGRSAIEAVQAASRRDTGTGDAFNVLTLDRAIAALEPAPSTQESVEAPEIPEGFTKWEGGECPVDPETKIEIFDPDATPQRIVTFAWAVNWTSEEQRIDHELVSAPVRYYRILSRPDRVLEASETESEPQSKGEGTGERAELQISISDSEQHATESNAAMFWHGMKQGLA